MNFCRNINQMFTVSHHMSGFKTKMSGRKFALEIGKRYSKKRNTKGKWEYIGISINSN